MKYLAFVAVTDVADKITPSVYIKNTEDDALAIFHRTLGNYLANHQETSGILCMVIRDDGFIVSNQKYSFDTDIESDEE